MRAVNRGAAALTKLIPERGDQTKLADRLDVDQGYLSRVARAERVPGLELRRKLREHFGIALESWDEPAVDAQADTERAPA